MQCSLGLQTFLNETLSKRSRSSSQGCYSDWMGNISPMSRTHGSCWSCSWSYPIHDRRKPVHAKVCSIVPTFSQKWVAAGRIVQTCDCILRLQYFKILLWRFVFSRDCPGATHGIIAPEIKLQTCVNDTKILKESWQVDGDYVGLMVEDMKANCRKAHQHRDRLVCPTAFQSNGTASITQCMGFILTRI